MTSALAAALARQDWELAALCLLLGVTRAAEALPPETIDALIEALADAQTQTGRLGARPGEAEPRRRAGRTGRGGRRERR
ncbi:MAG: hypothetical protein Q7T33_00925 [Dehalococcoidia bacterium]|nr:hypothetical protein [Dehalococcoidia bacterium]